MTLIAMWLAPDCWDEHFLFYNLSQNINSLKYILQILWTLLGPLFKGPAPSAWYHNKGPVILYISCSTPVQKILTAPNYLMYDFNNYVTSSRLLRLIRYFMGHDHHISYRTLVLHKYLLLNRMMCSITLKQNAFGQTTDWKNTSLTTTFDCIQMVILAT